MKTDTFRRDSLIYSSDMQTVLAIADSDFMGKVPYGAKCIAKRAFAECALLSIYLPSSVKVIEDEAFADSALLETVKLPSGSFSMGRYLFKNCRALKEISMPSEVTNFPEGLFSGCISLKEVPFRFGLTELKQDVISCMDSLESLVIPDSVKIIRSGAVRACGNLQTIVLPASLEVLEDGAFSELPSLCRLRINGSNQRFHISPEGDVLYAVEGEREIFRVGKKFRSDIKLRSVGEGPSIIDFAEYEENDEHPNSSKGDLSIEPKEESMEEKLARIMAEERSRFEETDIDDIPMASEEEVLEGYLPAVENAVSENAVEKEISEKSASEDKEKILESVMAEERRKFYEEEMQSIPMASKEEVERGALPIKNPHVLPKREKAPELDETQAKLEAIMQEQRRIMMEENLHKIPMASKQEIEEGILEKVKKAEELTQDIMQEEKETQAKFTLDSAPVAKEDTIASTMQSSTFVKSEVRERREVEVAGLETLFFSASKVMQMNIEDENPLRRIFFVFTEMLVNDNLDTAFSSSLVQCAKYLAKIHNFSCICFFYGVSVDNDSLYELLRGLLKNKDVLYAVENETLLSLNDRQKRFAECLGIPIRKEDILDETKKSKFFSKEALKLVLKDEYY